MMKSPRSLYRPRRPVAAIAVGLVTRRSPLNGKRTSSKPGIWFKNAPTCELGPTNRLPLATVDPPGLINSRVTLAAVEDGLVIAMPDCVDSEPSAYRRNPKPAFEAARPVSVTRMPAARYE